MLFKRCIKAVLLLVAWCGVTLSAYAGDSVILSVIDGKTEQVFSLNQLDQFEQHSFKTRTPWTSRHEFSGPLLKDVLQSSLKSLDGTLRARALNDYIVNLDSELMLRYPVILATRMDGKPMRIRNKGPIWIMFPLDQLPELDVTTVHSQMVWQLRSIESR